MRWPPAPLTGALGVAAGLGLYDIALQLGARNLDSAVQVFLLAITAVGVIWGSYVAREALLNRKEEFRAERRARIEVTDETFKWSNPHRARLEVTVKNIGGGPASELSVRMACALVQPGAAFRLPELDVSDLDRLPALAAGDSMRLPTEVAFPEGYQKEDVYLLGEATYRDIFGEHRDPFAWRVVFPYDDPRLVRVALVNGEVKAAVPTTPQSEAG